MNEAVSNIYRATTVISIRNAMKYAYKVTEGVTKGEYSAKFHGELYSFWRMSSGYLWSLDKSAATTVENEVDWKLDILDYG